MTPHKFQRKWTERPYAQLVELRRAGLNQAECAKALKISPYSVREWLEEGHADRMRERIANPPRRKSSSPQHRSQPQWRIDDRTLPPVPEDTRDLSARLCGDPLPGRSALDKLKNAGRWP